MFREYNYAKGKASHKEYGVPPVCDDGGGYMPRP